MLSSTRNSIKQLLGEQQLILANKFIQKYKSINQLGRLALSEVRTKQFGQVFPTKPETLNLLVNDVCNSRCQMCLIWKNKKEKEFDANELREILSDSLFSKLKYVGVSGGEPTLRKDLPELFRVICEKKPLIKGTGIITNGILEDVVKQRVLDSAEICKSFGVKFNIMLSLDGIGEVHDTVRGRANNFRSTLALLKFFHEETDIATSFGCTITTSNALYVDELLDYAKAEGLYGRFRVAEFIERLYNGDQIKHIRAFDDLTSYHLSLFFFRVEHDFEKSKKYQKTYRNIRSMLAEGKSRQIGCPYQSKAVVLTSRGDLLYCAPKSPILGNALISRPRDIFFSNLETRQKIFQEDCSDCIHDYHVPISFDDEMRSFFEKRQKSKYNISKLLVDSKTLLKDNKLIKPLNLTSKKVLIIGWYGTETIGDKAILWAIISRLRSRHCPPENIYLSSLYPFVSSWTIKEIGFSDISVIKTYSKGFEKLCNEVDEIVVGGGPLMGIKALDHILYAFISSAKINSLARIEGCGIGPLKSPVYTQVVSEILRLADHITLRDHASASLAKQTFSIPNIQNVPDPATDFVLHIKSEPELLKEVPSLLGQARNICCFLRAWSWEYAGDRNKLEYESLNDRFESELSKLLVSIARQKNATLHLLPMHTFHIGGDDRIFNRRLAKLILAQNKENSKTTVSVANRPISSYEILQNMYHSDFNICMRFHSVLFAETLGVPYIAIDYTGGGKIKAFLEERGKLDRLISLEDVAERKWKDFQSFCL